ncbi:MAG: tetratricopeptide repeat protein [Spirochaetales bacterium]|nr:tetratricopeptide repeat protein [Spirochaetales bacterium]
MDKASELLKMAIAAGKKRNYKKSIEILTHLLTHYESHGAALLYLGRSYHALGEFEKAIGVFDFLLQKNPDSEEGHFFIGRSYLAIGLASQAIYHLSITIEKNPLFVVALGFLGLAYLKTRRSEKAIVCFEKALKIDPRNENIVQGYLNAMLVQGVKLFNLNHFDGAIDIFKYLVKNNPEAILPHLYIARIYRLLDQNQLALKHIERAIELSPEDESLRLQRALTLIKLGKTKAGLDEMSEIGDISQYQETFAHNPGMLLRYLAQKSFEDKEYRKSVYFAKEILKANYKDAEVHALMAECYHKLGSLEKARNHYLRSIEQDKGALHYYHGLFFILWKQENFEELNRFVSRVLRLSPKDQWGHYFQALVFYQLKDDHEHAIQLLHAQIRKIGKDLNLYLALARIYFDNEMNDLAESWLLKSLALDKDHEEVLLMLIEVYHDLNQTAKAIPHYKHYFSLNPDNYALRRDYIKVLLDAAKYKEASEQILHIIPKSRNKEFYKKLLASCYIRLKKYDEAAFLFRELLQQSPRSLEYLQALLSCLDFLKNRKAAIELLKKAVPFFKGDPQIYLMLGVFYYKEGLYEEALHPFREVISKYPKNWKAYRNLSMVYKMMGNEDFYIKFNKRAQDLYSKQNPS